jgi:hypothetical protein
VCELSGIIIKEAGFTSGDTLTMSDVSIVAKVKELGFSAVAEAEALYRESKARLKKDNYSERGLMLLKQGVKILRREIISDPNSLVLKCRVVKFLLHIIKALHSIEEENIWNSVLEEFEIELRELPSEGEREKDMKM